VVRANRICSARRRGVANRGRLRSPAIGVCRPIVVLHSDPRQVRGSPSAVRRRVLRKTEGPARRRDLGTFCRAAGYGRPGCRKKTALTSPVWSGHEFDPLCRRPRNSARSIADWTTPILISVERRQVPPRSSGLSPPWPEADWGADEDAHARDRATDRSGCRLLRGCRTAGFSFDPELTALSKDAGPLVSERRHGYLPTTIKGPEDRVGRHLDVVEDTVRRIPPRR